jgi:hypothetical protein
MGRGSAGGGARAKGQRASGSKRGGGRAVGGGSPGEGHEPGRFRVAEGYSKEERRELFASIRRVLKRNASRAEIAALAGAPKGATVFISMTADPKKSFDVEWETSAGTGMRQIRRNASGQLNIYNEQIVLREQGTGLGTEIFAAQVRAATKMGVKYIEAEAARAYPVYVGYNAWPKMGYNAKIPAEVKTNLPAEFHKARYVSDLMATPEGRAQWKELGVTTKMKFDLTPGSYSQEQLIRYQAERKARNP